MPITKARRVLVAKDVLKQLRLKKLVAKRGRYIGLKRDGGGSRMARIGLGREWVGEIELQDYVDDIQKSCTVCAVGALVLSKARLFNDSKCCGISGRTEGFCKEWFGEQARLMEVAFEVEYKRGYGDKASKFGALFKTPRSRLAAIMRNVVKNGGVFKP